MYGGEEALYEIFSGIDDDFEEENGDFYYLEFATEAEFQAYLDNFSVEFAFPAAQIQANVIRYEIGAKGSNTFRGLTAGARYFVMVIAEDIVWDPETGYADWTSDAVGFTTTTIRAGETRTVSLDLGDNWDDLFMTLVDRYGWFDYEEWYQEPGTIVINLFDGAVSEYFFGGEIGSGQFFFDLLDGDAYVYDGVFWTDTSPESLDFENWYERADVIALNPDGTPATGGLREDLFDYHDDGLVIISGLKPEKAWRLLITDWQDRSQVEGEWPGSVNAALSSLFFVEPGGTTALPEVNEKSIYVSYTGY